VLLALVDANLIDGGDVSRFGRDIFDAVLHVAS
jgi:hypothetical protein